MEVGQSVTPDSQFLYTNTQYFLTAFQQLNGSQLENMKKSILDMSLP